MYLLRVENSVQERLYTEARAKGAKRAYGKIRPKYKVEVLEIISVRCRDARGKLRTITFHPKGR